MNPEDRNALLAQFFASVVISFIAHREGIAHADEVLKNQKIVNEIYAKDRILANHIDAMVIGAMNILQPDFNPEEYLNQLNKTIKGT